MGLTSPSDFTTLILDHECHEQILVLRKANVWSKGLRKASVENPAHRSHPCLGVRSLISALNPMLRSQGCFWTFLWSCPINLKSSLDENYLTGWDRLFVPASQSFHCLIIRKQHFKIRDQWLTEWDLNVPTATQQGHSQNFSLRKEYFLLSNKVEVFLQEVMPASILHASSIARTSSRLIREKSQTRISCFCIY